MKWRGSIYGDVFTEELSTAGLKVAGLPLGAERRQSAEAANFVDEMGAALECQVRSNSARIWKILILS